MSHRPAPCRHCKRRPVGSPAGLCVTCFARPEIRLLYQRGHTACPATTPGPRPYRPQKQPRGKG